MTSKPTSMTLVPACCSCRADVAGVRPVRQSRQSVGAASETAPATYKARFETSKGAFVVDVTRDWAPNGADRFYNLVKNGFYDGVRFFRVIDGFMAQFGINGDPEDLGGVARGAHPGRSGQAEQPARLHHLCDGRTEHAHQPGLHQLRRQQHARPPGFLAVRPGVVAAWNVVDTLYNGYGEGAPRGQGPDQGRVQTEGNAYLAKNFPRLDFVKKATITK